MKSTYIVQCGSRKKGKGGCSTFCRNACVSPLTVPVLRCHTMLLLNQFQQLQKRERKERGRKGRERRGWEKCAEWKGGVKRDIRA